MKNVNLVSELMRVEYSDSNDKVGYENHSYNGFLGMQGCEAYYNHLDKLYNDYFEKLRENIETLLFSDKGSILVYLNDKIMLFNSLQSNYNEKNYMDWAAYILSCEKYYSESIRSNQGAKNEYNTAKFFKEMSSTQSYFIEKGINDLQLLLDNYNTEKQIVDISNKDVFVKNNSLSKYVDNYFSRYSDSDTLTNKDLEFIFNITRPTIDKWKVQGKFIQISEEGKRPILYSKEDVKNKIKNGVLTHRLTDINKINN